MKSSRLLSGFGMAALGMVLGLNALAEAPAERESRLAKQREETLGQMEKRGLTPGQGKISPEEKKQSDEHKALKAKGAKAGRQKGGKENHKDRIQRERDEIKAAQESRQNAAKTAADLQSSPADNSAAGQARKDAERQNQGLGTDTHYKDLPKDGGTRAASKVTPEPYKEIPKH